jgi:aryl-alcohol dehydrogenase-like predicted oxidoreductase
MSLPSLALAATVATPGVTGAIAGSRKVDHVAENARVGDVRLDEDVLEELEAAVGIRAE